MAVRKAAARKRAESIKAYLREFRVEQRWTTFNGAVQLALAIPDTFDEVKMAELMAILEQEIDGDLICVYCGEHAATWDHLFNNVQGSRYSGYGNRIFNLVPACRTCNERKGSKHWRQFVALIDPANKDDVIRRLEALEKRNDTERYSWSRIQERHPELAEAYDRAQRELRAKVKELDQLAQKIRTAIRDEIDGRTASNRDPR